MPATRVTKRRSRTRAKQHEGIEHHPSEHGREHGHHEAQEMTVQHRRIQVEPIALPTRDVRVSRFVTGTSTRTTGANRAACRRRGRAE